MSDKPKIIVKFPGPILVQGDVELVDRDGNPIALPPARTPGTFKLCRCGRSAIQPFCDGSHKQIAQPVQGQPTPTNSP